MLTKSEKCFKLLSFPAESTPPSTFTKCKIESVHHFSKNAFASFPTSNSNMRQLYRLTLAFTSWLNRDSKLESHSDVVTDLALESKKCSITIFICLTIMLSITATHRANLSTRNELGPLLSKDNSKHLMIILNESEMTRVSRELDICSTEKVAPALFCMNVDMDSCKCFINFSFFDFDLTFSPSLNAYFFVFSSNIGLILTSARQVTKLCTQVRTKLS
mmetsp:Transcript_8803/g.16334  ORF Transcript_8803/g.16334 Transcript_8803/m.16334 type:complete len:218 (+) Transcript_8803:45-698(+)